MAPIALTDPLAELLDAAEGGRIEYHYGDAVKLAGHSCPTVAGAWLMTRTALARLYPDAEPQRGGTSVELRQAVDEGVAGVIASIAGLVTGAVNEGGSKGVAGRFGRQRLLQLGVPMEGEIRFTRLDNGSSVEMTPVPEAVPRHDGLRSLMRDALAPAEDAATREAFAGASLPGDWLVRHAPCATRDRGDFRRDRANGHAAPCAVSGVAGAWSLGHDGAGRRCAASAGDLRAWGWHWTARMSAFNE